MAEGRVQIVRRLYPSPEANELLDAAYDRYVERIRAEHGITWRRHILSFSQWAITIILEATKA